MGTNYSRLKKPQKALECYEKSIARQPTVRAYNAIGVIQENSKKHEQALSTFKKAQQLSLDLVDENGVMIALNNIGSCYYKLKRFDQALECFEITKEIAEKLKHEPVLNAVNQSLDKLKSEMK